MFDPEVVDPRRERVTVNLPSVLVEWIDEEAAQNFNGNRSIALSHNLRKLARYERDEQLGRIRRIPQKTAA